MHQRVLHSVVYIGYRNILLKEPQPYNHHLTGTKASYRVAAEHLEVRFLGKIAGSLGGFDCLLHIVGFTVSLSSGLVLETMILVSVKEKENMEMRRLTAGRRQVRPPRFRGCGG